MFGSKRWPAAALAGGVIAFIALSGCGTFEGSAPPGEVRSPVTATSTPTAPPEAVPHGQPAKTLAPDPLDAPAPISVLEAQRSAEIAGGDHGSHGDHGTGTYRQVDAGRGQTGAEPHQHQPATPTHSGHEAAAYVCPMHPEVTSNAPGECSKCGMDLVERKTE